jgi:hypothetical protein
LIQEFVKELGQAELSPLETNIAGGWKDHPSLFTPPSEGRLRPGTVSFSPATFNNPWYWQRALSEVPSPSPLSLGDPDSGGLSFLSSMSDTFGILGSALAATHPRLFDSGLQTMESIAHGRFAVNLQTTARETLGCWASPFSIIDLSVNRETLLHRDLEQMATAYTSIFSAGQYEGGCMDCPGMGIRFNFLPGTMVIGMTAVIEYGLSKLDNESVLITSLFDGAMLSRCSDLTPAWAPKLAWWDLTFLKPNARVEEREQRYRNTN